MRHISQNQNTFELNRQIIHQDEIEIFRLLESLLASSSENSSITLPDTPTLTPQQSIHNIPSELGSTPTTAQIRENPFNPPNPNERLPYWTTQSYPQGEPNLVNKIDNSSDTTLSSLPETLSLPSTPSISQISPSFFPLNISRDIDPRYSEQSTNIPLKHSWALNRLQYRQDIHEDIREHNVQILHQNSLQRKFEITVKLNKIIQHPYPLSPPNITAQTLPPPFITTEVIYKYDRYTKNTIGYITFYNPYSGLSYTCIF